MYSRLHAHRFVHALDRTTIIDRNENTFSQM